MVENGHVFGGKAKAKDRLESIGYTIFDDWLAIDTQRSFQGTHPLPLSAEVVEKPPLSS